ncbi:hypothetical protein BGP77_04435 [Saccharospirillum sp. MSK14-1]|uniref:DUF6586 family protein n=1 Tax=Saccharospirillum sp. MSK14-1 TaxID=1897632 RepID=UPI000D396B0A|nr:DUF6586 family protein [Saccharospirillum sp. MSK14-1]PTY36549.1 hypothetical protein BGP77_04435 [Saccharospirillum sp. MSK14-1]
MNRRAQTNQLLYQARLMLDQAEVADAPALIDASEDAAMAFMHRAVRSALAEAAEAYGLALSPDRPLYDLLRQFGEQQPDAWEYRTTQEALTQPEHWLTRLHQAGEHWAGRVGQSAVKSESHDRIELVLSDDQSTTNHYRNWMTDLQQWVDRIRELGDYS